MSRQRKKIYSVVVATLLGGSIATAELIEQPNVLSISQQIEELLSGIDFVPSRTHLDDMNISVGDLLIITSDELQDPGLRIRAYRALAHYPDEEEAKLALITAVEGHGSLESGVETLYVCAAMHSLATIALADAIPHIAPLLDHSSRDVRAAAADALAGTGSAQAIPLLRERLENHETVPQVQVALTDAIRVLSEER